jgi:two-component system osmolarity sensor histidine kinase EnvZ
LRIYHQNTEVDVDDWLRSGLALNMSPIPKNIPMLKIKLLPSFFTNQIEAKLAKELKVEHATVYFQFKPSPRRIQTQMNGKGT